ncbi:MAG: tetratricopeptide repeat protein [Candidatus Eisenbacteria bacterium]|nr:tetratricopeptide repeat protein [Candidatus Eisenbacteria bacterium]
MSPSRKRQPAGAPKPGKPRASSSGSSGEPGGSENSSSERFVLYGCTILILLPWIARFLPHNLVWGVHHLSFAPLWFQSLWTAAALLLLWFFSRSRSIPSIEERAGVFLAEHGLAPGLLIIAGTLIFWFFRVRTYFLGDGYLIGELVDRGVPFRTYDFLDYYLHGALWRLIGMSKPVSAFTIYAMTSVVAGICYLLAARWVSVKLVRGGTGRILLFALLVFAGPLEMFFGYVESYSFQTVFILLYLGAAILSLRGALPAWRAGLLFGLAVTFHTTTIFLLPTLLLLALTPDKGERRGARLLKVLGPPAAVVLAGIAILLLSGYERFHFEFDVLNSDNTKSLLVPLSGPYGLFSMYHLKDLMNLALLLTPVPCLLILSILFRKPRLLWMGPERRFLAVGGVTILLLIFLIDSKLGGARDWDLFAAQASLFTLLAFLAWGSWLRERGATLNRKASLLIVTAIFVAAPWYWVHAEADRSIEHFRSVLADFPSFPKAYAHEEIAKYFRNKEDMQESIREYRTCVETYPGNPRFRVLLAGALTAEGLYEEAARECEIALEQRPDYAVALRMMVNIFQFQKRYADVLPVMKRLTDIEGRDPSLWLSYGVSARKAGDLETAERALRRGLELQNDPKTELELAVVLGLAHKWEPSISILRRLITIPEMTDRVKLGLGSTLLVQSQLDATLTPAAQVGLLTEAYDLLNSYVASNPQDVTARGTLEQVVKLMEGSPSFP